MAYAVAGGMPPPPKDNSTTMLSLLFVVGTAIASIPLWWAILG